MKKFFRYFTLTEKLLWSLSVAVIIASFVIFKGQDYLSLAASLIGVTALIFCAKGNPAGQVLMIIFCLFYGYISLSFRYYGEMLTYVCMSLPMAIIALVSWVKNPFKGNKSEVKVNKITAKEAFFAFTLSLVITVIFYFILKALNTNNLIVSTVSVTTSFLAVYLSFKRSAFFAMAYAANDVVLIILWVLATIVDLSYLSVVICFIVFLVNDLYGFINWNRMSKKQSLIESAPAKTNEEKA